MLVDLSWEPGHGGEKGIQFLFVQWDWKKGKNRFLGASACQKAGCTKRFNHVAVQKQRQINSVAKELCNKLG